ncbi:hypothetical protein BDQ17DRAFT_1421747 [Cyathus striatus]|nr:hypothetical protein BDQ17DRAFT_1421747 [Cyathus striatus]
MAPVSSVFYSSPSSATASTPGWIIPAIVFAVIVAMCVISFAFVKARLMSRRKSKFAPPPSPSSAKEEPASISNARPTPVSNGVHFLMPAPTSTSTCSAQYLGKMASVTTAITQSSRSASISVDTPSSAYTSAYNPTSAPSSIQSLGTPKKSMFTTQSFRSASAPAASFAQAVLQVPSVPSAPPPAVEVIKTSDSSITPIVNSDSEDHTHFLSSEDTSATSIELPSTSPDCKILRSADSVFSCASDSSSGSAYTTEYVRDISIKATSSTTSSCSWSSTCTLEYAPDIRQVVPEDESHSTPAIPVSTDTAAASPPSPSISLSSFSSCWFATSNELPIPFPSSDEDEEIDLGLASTLDLYTTAINERKPLVSASLYHIPPGCKVGNLPGEIASIPTAPISTTPTPSSSPPSTPSTPSIAPTASTASPPRTPPPCPPGASLSLPPLSVSAVIIQSPFIKVVVSYPSKVTTTPSTTPLHSLPPSLPSSHLPSSASTISMSPPLIKHPFVHTRPETPKICVFPCFPPPPAPPRRASTRETSFSTIHDHFEVGEDDQKTKESLPPAQSPSSPKSATRRMPSPDFLCFAQSFQSGLSSLVSLSTGHSPKCKHRHRLRKVSPAYYPPWDIYTIYEDQVD